MRHIISLVLLSVATACQSLSSVVAPDEMRAPSWMPVEQSTASTMMNADVAPTLTVAPAPDPVQLSFTSVLTELDRPGQVFALPDNTLAVIEQVGVIRRIADRSIWLDMRDLVDANSFERGLFSAALSPFSAELFVSYTRVGDKATVVTRMPMVDSQPDLKNMSLVIAVEQPYANHNGGFMTFGPGQYLYIATGDGGSGNDPQNYAQNPQSLLGKVLRLDVRDPQVPYVIPAGQPVNDAWLPEIIAIGLRNPWRFGFLADQSMWLADVGQNKFEELNIVALDDLPSTNFGWRLREGNECRQTGTPECDSHDFTDPVAVYAHEDGHCSITGGEAIPHPQKLGMEAIVYGDFCSGTIWMWDAQSGARIIADTDLQISSFGRDASGALYVSDYRAGQVLRIDIE